MNEQMTKLSKTIVNYSVNVKEGDRVLITYQSSACNDLVALLINDIYENKGIPFIRLMDSELNCLLMEKTSEKRAEMMAHELEYDVNNYDCFINIRYTENEFEYKNISTDVFRLIDSKCNKFDDIRINDRRWVLFNYPSQLDAYKAKMKTEEFKEYAFKVMNVDYAAMGELIKPLKDLMEKTDKVRMIGPNTDITFSIKGMPAIPCCGDCNIPDGEIYTAPIKDSVNGIITYNTPSPYRGNVYNNVSLEFKDGKIIKATCSESDEELNKIFDTDPGARYIGEFAIGVNPMVLEPMGDILYDEKIMGSIHFTPGKCYDNADNGNNSAIHWDLVWIGRKDYGGGEIYFDDVLIRKDGEFVLKELQGLNYK